MTKPRKTTKLTAFQPMQKELLSLREENAALKKENLALRTSSAIKKIDLNKGWVRHIDFDNEKQDRVETGAVQFGNDWAGLFIRGDDCIALKIIIDYILKEGYLPSWSEEKLLLILKDDIETAVLKEKK